MPSRPGFFPWLGRSLECDEPQMVGASRAWAALTRASVAETMSGLLNTHNHRLTEQRRPD